MSDRRKARPAGALVGLSLLLVGLSTALATAADSGMGATGRYVVVLEDSVDHPGAAARAQVGQRDGRVGFVYRHALKGYSAVLPKAAVAGLRRDPRVKVVAPDRELEALSQTVPSGVSRIFGGANEQLDIDGEDDERVDVDIAIIDSGVDEHPDLDVVSQTYCDGSECVNGTGVDASGHGTHVAGTAAAIDNGEGVVGVAPGARLWSVKVLDPTASDSEIAAGIDWVTARAEEIEVANMSLGCEECAIPATWAAITGSVEAGVIYAVAAGNGNATANYTSPGNHPDVITVSGLADYNGKSGGGAAPTCSNQGGDDSSYSWSNWGPSVEIAAPGVCIYSTLPGGEYGNKSGTSMASPHVAGAAAILASQFNPETKGDVEQIRDTIIEEGNYGWTDTSEDGIHEPLLDVGNEEVFTLGTGVEEPIATTEAAASVGISSAKLKGTVSPQGSTTKYRFEYGPTTSYGTKVPLSAKDIGAGGEGVEVSETISGLDSSTTYHYRVVATNVGGTVYGEDETFITQEAVLPSATSESASEIGFYDAKLNGTVNPNSAKTSYQFEYGTTTSYGTKAPVSPKDVGFGGTGVKVGESISGLAAGATYHYRVAATNAAGTTYGEDKTFATQAAKAPTATTEVATDVGHAGAELHGTVNPNSFKTSYQFEYGPTVSYGAKVPVTAKDIGSGAEALAVDEAVLGLEASTTYHYRVVATSSIGTTYGKDETFATPEWSIEPTPNASEAIGSEQALSDVSCAGFCLATGTFWNVGGSGVLPAYRNEGGSWQTLGSSPPGGVRASGATCFSTCIAFGEKEEQAWAGVMASPWFTFPTEELPGASSSTLNGGQCLELGPSEVRCLLAGSYTESGEERTLIFDWEHGEYEWKSVETPNTGEGSALSSVSCNAVDSCVAVGHYYTELKDKRPFAMHWDGEEWTLGSIPGFEVEGEGTNIFLTDVSCTGPSGPSTACVAVGANEDIWGSQSAVSVVWDGTEWAEAVPVKPEGAERFLLHGVSCVSEAKCFAAGEGGPTFSESSTLIEEWDGSEWSISPTPNPEGHVSSSLLDISCESPTDCTAVGVTKPSWEESRTLAISGQ